MNSTTPRPTNRRVFMLHAAAATGAVLACQPSAAQGIKRIEESEPKAASLGYRHDSAQVDKKRFPKHAAGERCSNCMAFLGKPKDPWGECDLLADRMVSSGGWCSSYVKLA